jgi:hypothetical protein
MWEVCGGGGWGGGGGAPPPHPPPPPPPPPHLAPTTAKPEDPMSGSSKWSINMIESVLLRTKPVLARNLGTCFDRPYSTIMKINSNTTQIGLFVLGGAILYLGDRFSIPAALSLGLLCFGLLTMLMGIQMVANSPAVLGDQSIRLSERFNGLAAKLNGLLILMVSALLLVSALAGFFLPGGIESFWNHLTNTLAGWGILLILGGGAGFIYGITRILPVVGMPEKTLKALAGEFEELISGFFFLLVGIILAVVGGFMVIAPDLLIRLVDTIFR